MICTTKDKVSLRELVKWKKGKRRLLEEANEAAGDLADADGCHQAVWENTDPDNVETTAEAAVEAWLSYEQHFNYETGLPKEGKETEAYDFLNVINTNTEDVGYAIREQYVIGYFCPAANTDPEILRATTPLPREPPTLPAIPEGLQLPSGTLCPELDETGLRPPCSTGQCCGLSTLDDKTIDHCQDETASTYEKDGQTWSFDCYPDDARKLMVAFSAMIIIALSYF